MMNAATVIRQSRERAGLTQQELADFAGNGRVNVTRSQTSAEERGAPASLARLRQYDRVFRDPWFHIRICNEVCPFNRDYAVPLLNAIDRHPATMLNAGEEELGEAVSAVARIMRLLRNKPDRRSLSGEDRRQLEADAEQLFDVKVWLTHLEPQLHEQFGLDPRFVADRARRKYEERGYIRQRDSGQRVAAVASAGH